MPNEVEIRITATDLSGPAFAGAMARLAALKTAADAAASDRQMSFGIGNALAEIGALKAAMDGLTFGRVDGSLLSASLMALRSKLQSLGIADLADIDVQPGRLMTQLQLIKRLVDQAGISDVLDFNLSAADLAAQLDKLRGIHYDLPVNFDMARLPVYGETMPVINIPANIDVHDILKGGETMPVLDVPANLDVKDIVQAGEVMPVIRIPATIDLQNIPKFGETVDIPVKFDTSDLETGLTKIEAVTAAEKMLSDATASFGDSSVRADDAFSPLLQRMLNLAGTVGDGEKYMSGFGDILSIVGVHGVDLANIISQMILPGFGLILGKAATATTVIGSGFSNAAILAGVALGKLNDNVSKGLPMWQSSGNLWGGLGGKMQLFAGALTQIGLPKWIGAVSGAHLLADGIIEIGATMLPAIVGVGAFAAAAVDSTDEIYNHFVNMDKVIDMTQQNVYPLTGAFSRLNQAAQPEVYTLLGEGLQIVNHNAGGLQTVALNAGKALDDLGARFTYAMDNGNGFNVFVKNSATDITGWGNLIGNIGGILGNFLKVMPGYAEVLLNVAGGVTHLVEAFTGSALGQAIIGVGLAMHGFLIYVGLLGTGAAVLISRTLPALASGLFNVGVMISKMGLTSAGNALGDFAGEVDGLADLPWGWITIAAAGIGVLVYEFLNAKSAAQQFADNFQKTVQQVKLADLGTTLTHDIMDYTNALGQADQQSAQLSRTSAHVQLIDVGKSTQEVVVYSQAANQARQNVADYSAAIKVAKQDQSIYNDNLAQAAKVFGSNQTALEALTNAGITSTQMLTTSKQQMGENIIEAEGYNDAIKALTGGTGRYAAAMNALSGPEQYLGDMLKSIQSITQAQDNLMQVVTSGQNAWDTFALGQTTLAGNFGLTSSQANTVSHSLGDIKLQATTTGATMGGLNQASLTLGQSFYTQVSNGQQLIDALEQQEASTKNLTTATATVAGQLLPFAQNDEAARATLVAMINDALGPGTVSLQNLNSWVKNNATSMQGLNSIMEQSTVKAGTLANVLQTQLNSQFQADLLQSSGATGAMKDFTDAIVDSGNNSNATIGARAKLISDLEATGMSAQDSTNYVNGLQAKVDAMHGKTIPVNVDSTQAINAIVGVMNAMQDINSKTVDLYVNTYNAVYGTNAAANSVYGSNGNLTYASGGLVGGRLGTMGPDDRYASIRTGEFVVNPKATSRYLPLLQRINAQGGGSSAGTMVTPAHMAAAASAVYGTSGASSANKATSWGGGRGGTTVVNNAVPVALQVMSGSQSAFDKFMSEWMRNYVRVKGGGSVQKAFGKPSAS